MPTERLQEPSNLEDLGQQVGESPDGYTQRVLGLCHQVIDKFPELTVRFRSHRGTSVVSSALMISAAIAISARLRNGHSPERILEQITAPEILKMPKLEMNRLRKRLKRVVSKVRKQITRSAKFSS